MKFTKSKTTDIPPLKNIVGDKKKLKKSLIIFTLSLLFFLIATATYGVWSFFNTYSLQSPILVRSPLVPKLHEVLISPTASGSAKTSMVVDLGKVADKIYALESSRGKNDGCRDLGLFNGFGYRQNSFEHVCYSSHEEVRQLVITWLETHIKNGDVASALCMYNEGRIKSECTYSMNYKTIN